MESKAKIGLLIVLGLVTACAAPAQWQKAGVTTTEVREDTSRCRAFAASESARKYQADNPAADSAVGGPGTSFQGTMAENDAALFQNKVFNDCMTSHGYKKVGTTTLP